MILNNNNSDKAKGALGNIETRRIKWDTSLYNTFVTLELALALIESTNISGLCYNVKEGRYTKELAPGLGSSKPYSVPSTPV